VGISTKPREMRIDRLGSQRDAQSLRSVKISRIEPRAPDR
jgi:hypothetical protein